MRIKNLRLMCLLIILASCSSYKRTLIYSSLAGGLTGAMAGAALSPDAYSRPYNAAVFGGVGVVTGALIGHLLYQDDPRNKKLDNMLLDDEQKLNHARKYEDEKLAVGPVEIEMNFSPKERSDIPQVDLPDKLKDKVAKPYVIKHTSPETYLEKNGHTYYIPSVEIYEHTSEKK